jgi:hypothetical protein
MMGKKRKILRRRKIQMRLFSVRYVLVKEIIFLERKLITVSKI